MPLPLPITNSTRLLHRRLRRINTPSQPRTAAMGPLRNIVNTEVQEDTPLATGSRDLIEELIDGSTAQLVASIYALAQILVVVSQNLVVILLKRLHVGIACIVRTYSDGRYQMIVLLDFSMIIKDVLRGLDIGSDVISRRLLMLVFCWLCCYQANP